MYSITSHLQIINKCCQHAAFERTVVKYVQKGELCKKTFDPKSFSAILTYVHAKYLKKRGKKIAYILSLRRWQQLVDRRILVSFRTSMRWISSTLKKIPERSKATSEDDFRADKECGQRNIHEWHRSQRYQHRRHVQLVVALKEVTQWSVGRSKAIKHRIIYLFMSTKTLTSKRIRWFECYIQRKVEHVNFGRIATLNWCLSHPFFDALKKFCTINGLKRLFNKRLRATRNCICKKMPKNYYNKTRINKPW